MKYLIILYTILYFIPSTGLGLYEGCTWYNYLTYSLIHGNILHLVINMFSLYMLAKIFKNRISQKMQIILFLSLTTFSAIICNQNNMPTYGCSAGIYGMIGYWAYTSAWMSNYKTSIQTFALAIISIFITIPITNINTPLHFAGFGTGCTIAFFYSQLKNKI